MTCFFYGSYSEEWYSPFAAGVSCSTWLFCHATPPVYQLSLSLGLVVLISVLPLPTFFHSPHLWICNFSQVKSMWQQHFNLPAQNILHRGRRGFVTQEKWWPNGATRTNEIVDRGPNSVAQENWTTVNVEPCLSWGYLQTFLCYAFHSMPFIENITINAPSWLNNSVGTCMIIHLTGHILLVITQDKNKLLKSWNGLSHFAQQWANRNSILRAGRSVKACELSLQWAFPSRGR